jgi:uncharacterized protein (DUF1697 family)
MPTYIAILRGINVSGSKVIKMAELRACLESADFANVQTYIQSGNLRFESEWTDPKKVGRILQSIILKEFGHNVPAIVLTGHDIETVVASNPFLKKEGVDNKALYVTFLADEPTHDRITELRKVQSGNDTFEAFGSYIYLNCATGYGRTKLTNTLIEKKLGLTATSRNWKTVIKLYEMMA